MPSKIFRIHVCPGVDARAAARDVARDGAVGIDDIVGDLHDVVIAEILDRLGHAADEVDWARQRVQGPFGPVYILRDPERWTAAAARRVVLRVDVSATMVAEDGPPKSPSKPKSVRKPRLLAGGNPQIARGDGDAPVRRYLEALPGWKAEAGRRLDALIVSLVPEVKKAVRWNTPFYGREGAGWFLAFHCLNESVKVAFLRGASLQPPPPVAAKSPEVRFAHLRDGEPWDEALWRSWILQAAELPGDRLF
jgi:hypothetical protein